jgi:outer membrane protein assembly factor BamE (lipoprotein component of BamABCDE complex)
MMRSFLARLGNPVPRVVPLVLLTCLACATPFAIENLEEGMTYDAVRERFGEPVATDTVWDPTIFWRGTWDYAAESSWTYVDEGQNWWGSVFSSLLLPHQLGFTAIGLVGTLGSGRLDFQWDWAYVDRKPVVLHFEQDQLVRWEVIEPYYPPSSDSFMTGPSFHNQHRLPGC